MLKILGFIYKVFTFVFVAAFEAHATVIKNCLPRDVVKPKILKGKTTKYFDGY